MKKIIFITLLLYFSIVCLQAGEPFQAAPNAYIGLGGNYSQFVAGGFDGEEYYSSGNDFLLPVYEPVPGYGWGINLGYQSVTGLSTEMGVVQTYHGAAWKAADDFEEVWILSPGEEVDTLISSSVFYMDIKQNYLQRLRFQPYWRVGIGFNGTSSKEGYIEPTKELKGGFSGVSFRGGGGLEICITRAISFCAEGLYQFDIFSSAEWASGDAPIEPYLLVHQIKFGLWGIYRYSLGF